MQISVAHTLQILEASGTFHRACRAECVQQVALGIEDRVEGQIGICSQVSDPAAGG